MRDFLDLEKGAALAVPKEDREKFLGENNIHIKLHLYGCFRRTVRTLRVTSLRGLSRPVYIDFRRPDRLPSVAACLTKVDKLRIE